MKQMNDHYKIKIVRKIILSCVSSVLLFPLSPPHLSAVHFPSSKLFSSFFFFQEDHMACIHRFPLLLPEGEDLEPKAYGVGNEYKNYRVKSLGTSGLVFLQSGRPAAKADSVKHFFVPSFFFLHLSLFLPLDFL